MSGETKITDILDSLGDPADVMTRCRHGYLPNRCHQGCDLTGGVEFDEIHRPAHYNSHPSGIECIEVTRLMNFNIGNAVKYIWRWGLKDSTAALEKARFYLSDTLANGLAHHPSYAAKVKLLLAVHADDSVRGALLEHIAFGRLREAISLIDTLIKAANHPDTTDQD